jgi:hypothetical protein
MALFPPQVRDWALSSEAALTPKALSRAARESTLHTYAPAAAALSEDWGVSLDGKQLERWMIKLGGRLVRERDAAIAASEQGQLPCAASNPPELLVIGVDGGRVQMREKDGETQSRWKEDKVVSITSYIKGDGGEREPEALLTTYAASMAKTAEFGPIARLEAERRQWKQAAEVLVISDLGNWIDPLVSREFKEIHQRIADWSHAAEHLHAAARATQGGLNTPETKVLAERWTQWLWDGKVTEIIFELRACSEKLGAPAKQDGPEHPRRVLHQNAGYFERNKDCMNYPAYRAKGWPIGSGNTESGVKLFNKRVKGTDQFWQPEGIEAMLALRALYLSADGRWPAYWSARPAYMRRPA